MGKLSSSNGKFTFAAPPEKGPEIIGLSSHYAVGENVTANCTAWPSVPKANLRWTINGELVKYLSASPTLVNFPEASSAVPVYCTGGVYVLARPREMCFVCSLESL